jgi:hypothetical protein
VNSDDELQQHLLALDAWARLDPCPGFAQLKRRIDRLTTAEAERVDRHVEEIEATETAYQAACAARSAGASDTVEEELRKAALGGHPEAAYELAALLVERGPLPLSDDTDEEPLREAAAWLLEAIDAGAVAPEDLEDDLQRLWWIAPRLVAYDDQIEKLASPVPATQPVAQDSYGSGKTMTGVIELIASLKPDLTHDALLDAQHRWAAARDALLDAQHRWAAAHDALLAMRARAALDTFLVRHCLVACDGPAEPTHAVAPTGPVIFIDCCAASATGLSDALLADPYPPIDGDSDPIKKRLLRVLKGLRRRSVLTDNYTQHGRFPEWSYSVGFTYRAKADIDVVPLLSEPVVCAREESDNLRRWRRELLSLTSMVPAAVLFDTHPSSPPGGACRQRALDFDLLSPRVSLRLPWCYESIRCFSVRFSGESRAWILDTHFVGGDVRWGHFDAMVNLRSMLYGPRGASDIADTTVNPGGVWRLTEALAKPTSNSSRPHDPAKRNPRNNLEAALETDRRELTSFCYRMLGSGSKAEDAVQGTMARTWGWIDGVDGRSTLRFWLYRIANSVCIDMIRSPQHRALPLEMGPSSATSESDRLADSTPRCLTRH